MCTCILCIVILIEPFRCCMISSVCLCARWSRGIAGACMRSKIAQIRQTHCAYLVHTICANTRVLTTIYIRGFRGSKQWLTQTDRTTILPPYRNYLLYMCSNVDLFTNKKNTNLFEFCFLLQKSAKILTHKLIASSHGFSMLERLRIEFIITSSTFIVPIISFRRATGNRQFA